MDKYGINYNGNIDLNKRKVYNDGNGTIRT